MTWGNCEGVVEDVTLVGADALSLSGFSGLDVKVATYFRLRGDGDRWGVRAAAKALGEGVISARGAGADGGPTPPRSRRSGRAPPARARGGARRPAAARLPVVPVPRRAADAEAEGGGQRARRARVARRRRLGRGA